MSASRRDVLRAAVAASTAASLGFTVRGASAQAAKQIDGVLRQAVDGREVPGVVALAADRDGVLYAGVPAVERYRRADEALERVGLSGRATSKPTELSASASRARLNSSRASSQRRESNCSQ